MCGRRRHRAVAWLLIGALVLFDPWTGYAVEQQAQGNDAEDQTETEIQTGTEHVAGTDETDETGQETAQEEKEKIPWQAEKLVMTLGSSYLLDFRDVGKDDKITILSDAPDVVSANGKGKLKARKCGIAQITVSLIHKGSTREILLNVAVRYDRYFAPKSYGKGITRSSELSAARLDLHRQMTKGKTVQLMIGGLEADARVTYRSNRPNVAAVNANGKVRAKAAGKAVIKCTVVQNKKTYCFYEDIHVSETKADTAQISDKERDAWFSDAGFIGNSIGVGQKMYFDSQGKGYLGNPIMMVRSCYSFANDESRSNEYKVTYKGQPYKARTAVKLSGVKRLFVNMGTNDLWQSPEAVYKRYVSYLSGIKKDSPDVVIFVEGTTPVAAGHDSKELSNRKVDRLNQLMRDYCSTRKDLYYIDVNSCLKGSDGCLKSSYSSDQYVHLSMSGYAQWMKVLCAYTDQLMIAENRAEDAVKTAEESLRREDFETAGEIVKALEPSTVRTKLLKRLKNIRSRLK